MSAEEDTLYKGRRFDTYEELEMCVKSYETINKQKFYKIRSRTITSASNSLKRKLKQSLVYYEIEYACIHGKRLAKRGNGIKKTSTLRQGCEANFKLRVSSEGHSLQICSINTMHTKHELSQKVYDHLPQTRALNEDELKSVQTFLSLDANKKKIQSKVLADTGKKTTLKDLQNINYRRKIEKNDLDEVVSLLTKSYGCMVDIFCDEDEKFKAMQFTTQDMRNALNAWPEFISIDGTYKLIDIGCTVFLCLVVDSNGQSEIANVSLISTEDKKTYHWIFEQFKKHFDFTKVKSFMGDKDLVERQVVKDLFPNTPFYLCIFHTLKTFRREVTCDKKNISREERDLSLNYLQKLVYSKNESEYDLLYSQFKECVPQSVIAYFERSG
ncbi:PKS-NRPS hybrid synthetase CHGG_01239-like [Photinus pyralis]|uniref:PKS-NRPS hybrid synthetase CHGG_01239-like n=1 Tax=Photinus pyralis TaxID=7054 RepID=UPI0012674349|nr:PKS-NRPS hybrid synthetase CHGG_01239-like [Photinus pyralis]XP_031328483.1 PKS-NRPS hybrid synthetase CHGG_01239-like [Photinus pyralis]XP_031345637.1 PKS-NRPS hybrid synthetase CHGG_01239-like [Photinus pyralis]XP_031345638.1 PKS-NRPS hybrid synthetase CHGG_01239-like [Photinus pyralis]